MIRGSRATDWDLSAVVQIALVCRELKWLLHRFPHGQFTLAFILGHTVLRQTDFGRDICQEHELVHVRLIQFGSDSRRW
ncbi:MAG: hypothetical protein EA424_12105 [Planctomycetaceae bacterium]|nr:MAG: hypothetical protein EA424_12105 [Planctomycetaceae bacterium]